MRATGYPPLDSRSPCKPGDSGCEAAEKAYRVGRAHRAESTRRLAFLAVYAAVVAALLLAAPAWPHPNVSVWTRVADCETGDGDGQPPYRAVWHYNGRSGFDGGLQFSPSTWRSARALPSVRGFAGRYGYAYQAPAWVQIRVADSWLRVTSWRQWPACSRRLGLR